MTENTPSPTPEPKVEPSDALETPPNPFTPQAAKKAYSAGVAGLLVAVGAQVAPALADGALSGSEVAGLIGSAVCGFVVAFAAAWAPKNGN